VQSEVKTMHCPLSQVLMCIIIMAALCSRCRHYIFLYVCPVVCSSTFFLSWSNLSHHRLDVCHTSTRGVALVQIYNAGLKCAARDSLKIQDAKNRQKFAIWAPSYTFRAISLQLRHISTIGKKLDKHRYLFHMSLQYGELRPARPASA